MKLWKKAVALLLCATMTLAPSMSSLAFTAPTSDDPVVVDSLKDGYSDDANAYEIYPVPHYVDYTKGTNGEGKFTMTKEVNVVRESGVDEYTVKFLEEILTKYDMTATYTDKLDPNKTNILLGVKGSGETVDKSVENVTLNVEGLFDPKRNDPNDMSADRLDSYLLTVDTDFNKNGVVTIVGHNTDSTYYGVATLQMMFSSFAARYFYPIHIEDYSNTIYRGFIEGFYGVYDNPYWARESQMRSIRDVKGNIYVFAAKGDLYHGEKWNVLYPEEELNDIKHLVEVSKETKVQYAWSVHLGLGKFFSGVYGADPTNPKYQEKLAQLLAKFEQLYAVGVRNFHVLNDDYNSGNYAQAVMLLNDLNKWRKEKGCGPIIYCMNGYGQDFSKIAELTALQAVDPDVFMYWTGGSVNTPITQSNINYPLEKSKHYPVTWLNFPCSEHCGPTAGKYLPFLGDISYYVKGTDGLQNQKGIICNPVKSHTESTKVGFFQMLSWGWNRDNYSTYSNEIWEDCFKYLQPEVYESYLTIARNISNAADSGRVPQNDNGFPESEYIKQDLLDVKAKVLAGDTLKGDAQVESLLKEFDNILAALDDFNKNCANKELLNQIDLWLITLEDVVNAAKESLKAAIALQENDMSTAWTSMSVATNAMQHWYATAPGKQPTTGRGSGSKRIQPFAKAVLKYVDDNINDMINPDGGDFSFYAQIGGVDQSESPEGAKVLDGNKTTVANFKTNQQVGDYYGVDLGSVKLVSAVDVLQGETDVHHDYFHKATLESSVDGVKWDTLVTKVNSHHIRVENMNLPARYVRLRLLETGYGSRTDFWTNIREFTVNTIDINNNDVFYTNVPGLTGSVTEDGGTYTMAALSAVTLEKGQYVGIRLPEITGIKKVEAAGELPAGLTLQYSTNGVVWNNGTPAEAVATRYVRVVNTSDAAVTADIPAVSATKSYIPLNPKEVLNVGMSIYQSNRWSRAVDGDRSTMAWTGKKQNVGDKVVFDLGGNMELYDLTVVTTGNGEDYPRGMSISISDTLDGEYTVVGTIDNDMIIDPTDPVHKIFTCDAAGKTARYLKLEITQEIGNWLQIHEIEINKTHDTETSLGAFSGTPVGDFSKAMDNSLASSLTFAEAIPEEGGFLQYLLSGNTTPSSIVVFQGGTPCNAAVKAQLADGTWKTLGTLDEAVKTFNTKDLGDILALRLDWVAGSEPAIAEIVLRGGAESGPVEGEVPELHANIFEPANKGAGDVAELDDITVEFGTAVADIALPETANVTVSDDTVKEVPVTWTSADYNANKAGTYTFTGTFNPDETLVNPGLFTLTVNVIVKKEEGGQPVNENLALEQPVEVSGYEPGGPEGNKDVVTNGINDSADINERWSSNFMKGAGLVDGQQTPSWVTVDLGEDVSSITSVKAYYHAKVWPTNYRVEFSADGETWTTAASMERADGSIANDPIDTFEITADKVPAGVRYVRLYFNTLNTAAGGHAVGLRELEVYGTRGKVEIPVGEEENLSLKHDVFVSGLEVDYQTYGPEAVDGSLDNRWSGNGMKAPGATDNQTPSWIVVDLGEKVAEITSIRADYFAKVWPTDYVIQVASEFNGGDFSDKNIFANKSEGTLVDGTITGDNAPDAAIWTTIKTFAGQTISDNGFNEVAAADFEAEIPAGTRYVRLYFTGVNKAAGGHSIGLKELTVNGKRYLDPVEPGDTTAPVITGVQDGSTYCTDMTITVTDEHLATVTVDGTAVTLGEGGTFTLTAGTHTVVATDESGNSTTVTVTINAGHVWDAPQWTWGADYTATAKFVCKTDNEAKEVTATVTNKVTTEPGCETKGTKTYTATVTLDGKNYTDTKTEEIAATGHVWGEPVWTWNGYEEATATFICEKDATHTVKPDVTVVGAVTKAPGCETTGEKTYTASVVFGGENYTSTNPNVEEIAATGHDYHDGICDNCGEKDPDYKPVDPTDPTEPGKPADEHKHEGNGAWVSDGKEHWHVCECGDIIDKGTHTVGKDGECTVCHKVLGAPTDSNNGNQNAGSPNTGDDMNVLPWIVLIGAAVVAAVVVLKRKKK